MHLRGGDVQIDEADVDLVLGGTWRIQEARSTRYVVGRVATSPAPLVYLHRLISGAPPRLIVDHVDGDGLNNRRANLRVVTNAQNIWNDRNRSRAGTSQFKGVFLDRGTGKWRAMITSNGARRHLGLFATEIDAAAAYDEACDRERDSVAVRNLR